MADLSIRDLDDDVKHRLQRQAAEHGRSMEAEARAILEAGVASEPRKNLAVLIMEAADRVGGFGLEVPPRELEGRSGAALTE